MYRRYCPKHKVIVSAFKPDKGEPCPICGAPTIEYTEQHRIEKARSIMAKALK